MKKEENECNNCCYCNPEIYTAELTFLEIKRLLEFVVALKKITPDSVAEWWIKRLEEKCDEAKKNGETRS